MQRGPFELAFHDFIDNKVDAAANNFVRGLIYEISTRFIARSPIKSGRFVSNWFYSPDTASEETRTSTMVRVVGGLDRIPDDAAMRVHYIVNNLPYAWRLENGWSMQAPLGIVGITVAEYNVIVGNVASAYDSLGSLGLER